MMVNRTKISKEIHRRTGGISKTGNGKTVKQINLWKDKWEKVPGTGTGPSNPIQFRLKKKEKLPEKKKTKKPVGISKADLEKAMREKLAGSLGVGHPITPVKELERTGVSRIGEWRQKAESADVPTRTVGQRLSKEVTTTNDKISSKKRSGLAKDTGVTTLAKDTGVTRKHGSKVSRKRGNKIMVGYKAGGKV